MSRGERIGLGVVLAVAAAAMLYGWRLFWFLTDDAFIAFRYVANSHLGVGYVWNFPPFLPVEGYTSFLWVLLLDIVWRLTGVAPPDAANPLGLLFALGSLALTARLVWRIPFTPVLARWRVGWVTLALAGVVSNRTFLAWASSGLETAVFNFFLLLWVTLALEAVPDGAGRGWRVGRLAGCALAAALTALSRPDGLLAVAATVALFALALWRCEGARRVLAAGLPLLLVPAHLLWRYQMYGAWLPNTFYAKVGGGLQWDSGSRYLLAFVLEYGWWLWGVVGLMLIAARITDSPQRHKEHKEHKERQIKEGTAGGVSLASALQPGVERGGLAAWLARAIIVGTVAAHAGYYTLLVGGDHFEFRVYSQLVPLLWVGLVWLLNGLRLPRGGALAVGALALLLSLPLPWGHWALTRGLETRAETGFLRLSLAEAAREQMPWLPTPAHWYLETYDAAEFWLIERAIGMRHQEHKVFQQWLAEVQGARPADARAPMGEAQQVMLAGSVGVVAWRNAEVNIIDVLGLNDYVVARGPIVEGGYMAHNRSAPPGYLECFVNPPELYKAVAITAAQIRACEAAYR